MPEMIPDPKHGVKFIYQYYCGACQSTIIETYVINKCPACPNTDLLNLDDLPDNPTLESARLVEAYKARVRRKK